MNWLGLRLIGFRGWKAVLAWFARETVKPSSGAASAPLDSAQSIARLAESAARHLLFKTNCLEQSMALWWMLRRRGITAELYVGARKGGERFEAHAWVEYGGIALNDAHVEHGEFTPFDAPLVPMKAQTP